MQTALPVILGSSSPSRRLQMQQLGIAFEVDSADIDETALANETPVALVKRLSLAKAKVVGQRHPNSLVIGCDQVCDCNGQILGKPLTHENAVAQLQQQSGQTVIFHAGLCVLNTATNQLQVAVIPTEIKFRQLSDSDIESYLQHDQPYQCAASIRSEGLAIHLVESIRSDDPNALMGLPLISLCQMLRYAGIVCLNRATT